MSSTDGTAAVARARALQSHGRCRETLRTISGTGIAALVSLVLAGCGPLRFVDVASENHGGRVEQLVFHYTSTGFAESLRLLTQRTGRPVSAHYLVPENGDPSYPGRRLRVYRLVEEGRSAWHAGQSYWRGERGLNGSSIGIEVVQQPECSATEFPMPRESCFFLDFDPEQIDLVIELALDILERHPNIDPVDVVGHADIAPDRRVDPGPTFPWRRLHEHGIGAWYDDDTVAEYLARFEIRPPHIAQLQRALRAYGYDIEDSGEIDYRTGVVLRAFQMHFRPSDYSGVPDAETAAILFALLEKYQPEVLACHTDLRIDPCRQDTAGGTAEQQIVRP